LKLEKIVFSLYLCVNCGESALGKACDGLLYCQRAACIDWKAERIKAAKIRKITLDTAVRIVQD
jgi:hypothetical protein